MTPVSDTDRSWALFPHGLLVFERPRPTGQSRLLVSRVESCTTPDCSVRHLNLRAIALDIDEDFDPAALGTDALRAKFETDAMDAQLDLDDGRVLPEDDDGRVPLSTDWVEYLESQIDGELLDVLHEKWLRAKGMTSVPTKEWEPRDPGGLVGWYEAHPSDRVDLYNDGDDTFLAEDLHCVNPTCTCSEAVVAFSLATVRSAPDIGSVRVRVPSLEVVEREVKPDKAALLDRLWHALATRHRNLGERLSQRKKHMAELASDVRRRTPVTRSAARVGRNDPCPCGSGKKYKRCCA